MKKLSITFGNGVYFDCFPSDTDIVYVTTFTRAWFSKDPQEIEKAMDKIKERLPDAQLSVVSHEPQPYKL